MINLLKPIPELRRGFKDKKHLNKVATLPCMICKKTPIEIHHEWGQGGGKKASDRLTFPLCNFHHTGGFSIRGVKGETLHTNLAAFEKNHKTQKQLIKETYQQLGLEELYDSYGI